MVELNVVTLKRRLRDALTDRTRYPGDKLTLRMVMDRAAEIALLAVDELVPKQKAEPKAPAAPKRKPGAGSPDSPRRKAALEKRERLLKVMQEAAGPIHYGEVAKKAQLTPGECSWILRSTPTVVSVGKGCYALVEYRGQSAKG